MDTSKRILKILKEWIPQLRQGMLFLEFQAMIKDQGFKLTAKKTRFGLILFVKSDKEVWNESMVLLKIINGKSVHANVKDMPLQDSIKFIKDNQDRVVVRLFERQKDGQPYMRFYLKKVFA